MFTYLSHAQKPLFIADLYSQAGKVSQSDTGTGSCLKHPQVRWVELLACFTLKAKETTSFPLDSRGFQFFSFSNLTYTYPFIKFTTSKYIFCFVKCIISLLTNQAHKRYITDSTLKY